MISRPPKLEDLSLEEIRRLLNVIASGIEECLPPEALFALVIFDGAGNGRYVSNANRQDMAEALREIVGQMEAEK